ncbi:glucan endo-1,3-beta-glucosidase-like [Lotus japonicus]|uniref:glucan endo-1,3-beta-glucosidase-like n=1 Tax=Lotus japonicus TaxID=34305 RepID=UPI00258C561E|nr:glucan endo-1,3-beta-glucosidase-like [Lotus japonicus]
MSTILLLLGILSIGLGFTAVQSVGVCYGVNGDNLPSKQEVVDLYKANGIGGMRIYSPNEEVLEALRGSDINLILDVAGETLASLADVSAAAEWVSKFVTPYSSDVKFKYIAVGNEVHPSDNAAQFILPVMQNIQRVIWQVGLQDQIKVTTVMDSSMITNSYPPSASVFTEDAKPYIEPIINFLVQNGSPLLANVYPYFAYANDQQNIPLAYALFTQNENNDIGYGNLFDAMVDSIYSALEKSGAPNLAVVVAESGWPSEGGDGATMEIAATYYANLIGHIKSGGGTPKRPNGAIETYLFAMFDENMKPGAESERHFGLFHPDKSSKYEVGFN